MKLQKLKLQDQAHWKPKRWRIKEELIIISESNKGIKEGEIIKNKNTIERELIKNSIEESRERKEVIINKEE